MITIAVTGGIGSGKSTVTDYLIKQGYTVIDADKMSREMTSSGGKAMPYILKNFGPDFINPDGSLNRMAMRDLVFRDPRAKSVLEEGTTRIVLEDIEKIKAEKREQGEKFIFFDIPLLFETHQEDNYDLVWVVAADRNIRRDRIMMRDDLSPEIADLMISSQEEDEVKINKADTVLYNNGTVEELITSVDEALRKVI